jgi:hypothetical protein
MGFSSMMSGLGGGFGGWTMYLGATVLAVGLVALVVWLVVITTATRSNVQMQPTQAIPAQLGRETAMDELKRRDAASYGSGGPTNRE